MRKRVKRVKKSANIRIYDNLTALYGSKVGQQRYKLTMLQMELKSLNI